jgi:uncharacterized membrane protein
MRHREANLMRERKSVTCTLLGLLLTFVVSVTAADAPPLTFKFTTINVPGAIQTIPSGVNNSGVVVGEYQDKSQGWYGYILDGKKLTKLDDPNGIDTACVGINLNGAIAIVGNYENFDGRITGFLYQNGKFKDIPGPASAIASYAFGTNDSGEIVGSYLDSAGVTHGFLLKGKRYTTLDVPGGSWTEATGINNKGSVILIWLGAQNYETSLYNGKTYKTINVPGASESEAVGINSEGDVTYAWFRSNSNIAHGALLHAGKYFKFDDPKGAQTYAEGINDHHLIVGTYQTSRSVDLGFKATY